MEEVSKEWLAAVPLWEYLQNKAVIIKPLVEIQTQQDECAISLFHENPSLQLRLNSSIIPFEGASIASVLGIHTKSVHETVWNLVNNCIIHTGAGLKCSPQKSWQNTSREGRVWAIGHPSSPFLLIEFPIYRVLWNATVSLVSTIAIITTITLSSFSSHECDSMAWQARLRNNYNGYLTSLNKNNILLFLELIFNLPNTRKVPRSSVNTNYN